jgi:arsenate reductase
LRCEVGVDLTDASTKKLTSELAQHAQVLVTMGCGDECLRSRCETGRLPLKEPKGKLIEKVRQIREEIRGRVQALIDREGWAASE